MPYIIVKSLRDGSYMVCNVDNGTVKSAHTTLSNAKKQIKLLHWIDAKKHADTL